MLSMIQNTVMKAASPSFYRQSFMNMRKVYDPQVRAGGFMPVRSCLGAKR